MGNHPNNENVRRILRAFGQEAHVLISSEQSEDAFCRLRFFAGPENTAPPHMHQNEDETFIVEGGEIEVDRGGEVIRGKPGDVIYLPKKIPHAPKILGAEPLQAMSGMHQPASHVEGCKERRGSMAFVLVSKAGQCPSVAQADPALCPR